MGKLTITTSHLNGAAIINASPNEDERGSFNRCFCYNELSELMGEQQIVAVNHSRSDEIGTIRGIHYQRPPFAEIKMVRCLKGKVFDVMVDLRSESETFLQWHSEILSSKNHKMMFIPESFGHGFQVLEPKSELLYLHTAPFKVEAEGGVLYNDPAIGIKWPLAVTEISVRDLLHNPISIDRFTL
ncbi:dTDP-4-dehydrorhamnose 3,5-epimerase family protein [Desulfopila sp. IMCC35008]|uniref:dTDP-4-dehydrorhamnose 3,5-epimerase family protein n=1 Tax=Desulfopila sp. IMCC35008 TaxID=2653858 RepID=UPI0013D78ACF|nr:dTDP-4-dehydrorhamnose 3,5-epimerase family protein [Desulfopila sp. IMCC35008]